MPLSNFRLSTAPKPRQNFEDTHNPVHVLLKFIPPQHKMLSNSDNSRYKHFLLRSLFNAERTEQSDVKLQRNLPSRGKEDGSGQAQVTDSRSSPLKSVPFSVPDTKNPLGLLRLRDQKKTCQGCTPAVPNPCGPNLPRALVTPLRPPGAASKATHKEMEVVQQLP